MSRVSWRPDLGWLMYAGNLGGRYALITGEVRSIDVSMHQDVIDVTSVSSPDRIYIQGQREVTVTAWMGDVSVVQQQEHVPPPPPPAEIKALRALARRHPEEYAELREGESIMRALSG